MSRFRLVFLKIITIVHLWEVSKLLTFCCFDVLKIADRMKSAESRLCSEVWSEKGGKKMNHFITYTLLSLDMSLHKPLSANFILPAIFETSKWQRV